MPTIEDFEGGFLAAVRESGMKLDHAEAWAAHVGTLLNALQVAHFQAIEELAAALRRQPTMAAAEHTDTATSLAETLEGRLGAARAEPFSPEMPDTDLGFCHYWLQHPPQDIQDTIDSHPVLKPVWSLMQSLAPAPLITPDEIQLLEQFTLSGWVLATPDGTVMGFSQYEQLDVRWLWTVVNLLLNHWSLQPSGCWLWRWFKALLNKLLAKAGLVGGLAKFKVRSDLTPIPLVPGPSGAVKIAVIGDWGTGRYGNPGPGPAEAVLKTVVALEPDYIIHLGDTYYAGTPATRPPANEEENNLLDLWRSVAGSALPPGRYFTLNSNHEMYGGAYGLMDVALTDPLFSAQGGTSYFSLSYGNWLIGALDSGYYDPSPTYLKGGLGSATDNPEPRDPSGDPQYAFLDDFKARAEAGGLKTILMCHHNAISTDGTEAMPMWGDVTGTLKPDYWYWGHIHLGAVYTDNAFSGNVKARCVGHSAIPIATPYGFEDARIKPNIEFFANTIDITIDPAAAEADMSLDLAHRIMNGFAMITLTEDDILEEFYDAGSTVPTWSSNS